MSLRSFLEEMEKAKEVIHVRDQVSTQFEASAIMKDFNGDPILFFENVEGHDVKMVANICGTRERICSALRVSPQNLYKKLIGAWSSPVSPRIVKKGSVKDVAEKASLSSLPVLTHFEKDPGAYITSAIVSARSPDGKIENISIHRLQILDEFHLAIRLVPRQLFKLWKMAKDEKRDLEVAISIGLHPAVLLAASSSVPFGVSEFGIANVLLGNKMDLVKCESVDAYAPAESEIVLEGVMSTKEETTEGPFVDITGTYDIQRSQPTIELVGMMHREDCLYQALLPSGTEHRLLMGLPKEALIWEAVAKVVPFVKGVNLSVGGGGWLHAIISIEKQTDGDGKNALLAAFGAHGSLKHAVVVDTDIDVYNLQEVEWAIATRFQASEDLIVIPHVRGSTLDPSSDQKNALTTKMAVDATCPLTKPHKQFSLARIPSNKRIDAIIDKIRKNLESELKN